VEFYGLGNSGITAADAQHKFFRFGISTVAYADTHIQMMAASVLGPDDVLVAISSSGRSRELLDAVEEATASGATVVAITASGSPWHAATIALMADTQEDNETYSPMISRIIHLVLIDVLAVGVALRRDPGVIGQLEKNQAQSQSEETGRTDRRGLIIMSDPTSLANPVGPLCRCHSCTCAVP
jgi:RpiR family carbohydrate utilization transcriptional regulator